MKKIYTVFHFENRLSFSSMILLNTSCSELLKCHYDQKLISFSPSDFESVFAQHLTGKVLSFEFSPKAVYFECKFWISRSAITHIQK